MHVYAAAGEVSREPQSTCHLLLLFSPSVMTRASTERSFHSQEENRCDTETARTFGDNWLRQDENHLCHRFTARCAAGGTLPVFKWFIAAHQIQPTQVLLHNYRARDEARAGIFVGLKKDPTSRR